MVRKGRQRVCAVVGLERQCIPIQRVRHQSVAKDCAQGTVIAQTVPYADVGYSRAQWANKHACKATSRTKRVDEAERVLRDVAAG
jgi:hypothetical protein